MEFDEEEAPFHSIINGQRLEDYSSLDFGTSTIANSGCGAIAVHNATLLSGHYSDIRSWTAFFVSKSLFRKMGVMPWEIDSALDYAGLSYIESGSSSIVENCKKGGVAIVTFWNSIGLLGIPDVFSGAHTVTITFDARRDQYTVYNASSWRGEPYYCTDVMDGNIGEGFIYGYYIMP